MHHDLGDPKPTVLFWHYRSRHRRFVNSLLFEKNPFSSQRVFNLPKMVVSSLEKELQRKEEKHK